MKIGLLVTNLGTPDAPTTKAVRSYLAEFLWDRRVVDLPRPLWWLVLHLVILRIRPRRSAKAYSKVWTEAGSPLLTISQDQCSGLQQRLGENLPVALGMRYGNPSISSAIEQLMQQGCDKLIILPLYPQYCSATTASTLDAVADALRDKRNVPSLEFIKDYHDNPEYIKALATTIRERWDKEGEPEQLIFSFHGVPQQLIDQGDPYLEQSLTTAKLVATALGLEPQRWQVTFQSRVGKQVWLSPYTDQTLIALGKKGVKKIDIICPGFSADCLETLEEIEVENRDYFLVAGGERLRYIPALNNRGDHLDMLTGIVNKCLS